MNIFVKKYTTFATKNVIINSKHHKNEKQTENDISCCDLNNG